MDLSSKGILKHQNAGVITTEKLNAEVAEIVEGLKFRFEDRIINKTGQNRLIIDL